MKRDVGILILLSLLQSVTGFSQDFRFENITSEYVRIEKGLSQNTILSLIQDQEGYLWAGTWSGLNRFDGYEFKTFVKSGTSRDRGLVQSTIVGLAEDDQGHIWAASSVGLNRINKSDFTITQFTVQNSRERGLVCDSILCLYRDRADQIWIGTTCGAFIMDTDSLSFRQIEHNPRNNTTISSNQVTAITEDLSGTMWIGTRYGLNQYNPVNGQVIRYYPGTSAGQLVSSEITSLAVDASNNLWIGSPEGLHRFRSKQRSFDYYPIVNGVSRNADIPGNRVICLFIDNRQNLWIGTQASGLLQFNPRTTSFIDIKNRISESELFSYTSFNSMTQDRNGLYWIGTSYKGLVKLVPDPHAFYEIVKSYSIYGILEPKPNEYWFGTQEGVLVFDRKTNQSHFIQATSQAGNSLSNNLVTALVADPPYVWICTREGLNRYNRDNRTNRVFRPVPDQESVSSKEFWQVCKDYRGVYWFAGNYGISSWNPKTDKITNYLHDPDNPNSLSNNYCMHIMESEPGILLISTRYGLNEFRPSTNQWKKYLPVEGNALSIRDEYVFGVYKDRQDELWVYTNGGGFAQFNSEAGTFENYSTSDGLSDNIVYGMIEDRDGIFWLITNNGLSRFDPRDNKFTVFDVQDGLFSNEFNILSICESQSGEILLGGVDGVNAFLPQTTLRTSRTPVIRLSGIMIHSDTASYEIPYSDTIRIRSSENNFSLSFSLLDFLNPFKNQYQYFLENFDEGPTTLPQGIHQVDYRKVPPGHYVFRVSGVNSLGIKSDDLNTTIIVVPAWHQTLIFKILVSGLSALILFLIIYVRSRGVRRRHQMEKQLLTIQAELIRSQKFALRSQMNPHFIFNSLNSIQNFVLKNDVDSANYYLASFSTMMRKVLEYSQYNYISLHEELELIELYLKMEHMRFSRKFETEIFVDPAIDQHVVRIPPMLLQPYLENAILHGLQLIKHKGLLQVRINDAEDHMLISIIDNGIGRERARAIRERTGHKSKGLVNIEKRIQLYNKLSNKHITVSIIDLADASGNASGTRIEIAVPYEMEEYPEEIF